MGNTRSRGFLRSCRRAAGAARRLFGVAYRAFRKHGLHVADTQKAADCSFWPDQVLKDAIACLAVLLAVLFCIFWPAISGHASWSNPGHWGAELSSPADPASTPLNARPEWYFLFLFQFLKLFEGHGATGELIGAIVIPSALLGMLFLMPFLGRWKLGHRFNLIFLGGVLLGAAWLTWSAIHEDTLAKRLNPAQFQESNVLVKIRAYDPSQPEKLRKPNL